MERPKCRHCGKPSDVIESKNFYSCAECYLEFGGERKLYEDNDDFYIMKSREWAKEKANG